MVKQFISYSILNAALNNAFDKIIFNFSDIEIPSPMDLLNQKLLTPPTFDKSLPKHEINKRMADYVNSLTPFYNDVFNHMNVDVKFHKVNLT